MAQTQEDFETILNRHNEFARVLTATKALDYHSISEAAEEIRKRATRLQTTLALHEPAKEKNETKEPEEINDTQLKKELTTVCKLIRSFVTNPMIETPNTVNADDLARARHDLESVVQMSMQIKRDANKLLKPSN